MSQLTGYTECDEKSIGKRHEGTQEHKCKRAQDKKIKIQKRIRHRFRLHPLETTADKSVKRSGGQVTRIFYHEEKKDMKISLTWCSRKKFAFLSKLKHQIFTHPQKQ